MPIIDEEGRLFGLINLVDALVVLLLLAVVAAGTAFALSDDPGTVEPETETRYATLDMGTQPEYLSSLVRKGETINVSGADTLTVTDVYATGTGSDHRLLVRVELEGRSAGDTIEFGGEPPRVGREITIQTDGYQVAGQIVSVDETGADLPLHETPVLLRATLPADTAESIEPGDEYRVNGRTIGTIESVAAYGTEKPENGTVLLVGVTYQAFQPGSQPRLNGSPIREGSSLSFAGESYEFDGEVVRVGSTEERGEPATRSVTLELENVDPALANSLEVGMTERTRGEELARITDVDVDPATVVVANQDGELHQREHPVNKDVTVMAELQVRETNSGLMFKGNPLQYGDEIVLDLGIVTIRATTISVS